MSERMRVMYGGPPSSNSARTMQPAVVAPAKIWDEILRRVADLEVKLAAVEGRLAMLERVKISPANPPRVLKGYALRWTQGSGLAMWASMSAYRWDAMKSLRFLWPGDSAGKSMALAQRDEVRREEQGRMRVDVVAVYKKVKPC